MDSHKFKVGQLVTLRPSAQEGAAACGRQYKIQQILPGEHGGHAYRIKTITEANDRLVMEGDIVLLRSVSLCGEA